MRHFITGTAGFIGFHLAKSLLEAGHEVHGFDGMTEYYDTRLKYLRLELLHRFPLYKHTQAMLEDFDALDTAVKSCNPDTVIHLAAQAGVRYSLENPRAYVNSNLVGSFNILEVARIYRPQHLLLASTSSVYGANQEIPFEETHKVDEPLTLYAATKKSTEVMAHSYAHLWKIPTTVFRFFTVYGPFGRPDMALFKFTEAALNGMAIDVYGEGRQERDFTYIADLVTAIEKLIPIAPNESNRIVSPGLIDNLSKQGPFRVVNLGGGAPIGLLPFIDTLEDVLGVKIKRNMLPMQKGDVPRTSASPKLLQALTGYTPATPLKEGVTAFLDWYKEWRATSEADDGQIPA